MSLHYQSYGEGEPLIILHGLFGSLGNWHTLAKGWGANYSVYALDQRNHGQSFHSDQFNYHVMAEDLQQFIAEHKITAANILGHSMGGKTAMFFAVQFPQLVKRLIVADIAPKEYPPQHQEIFETLHAINLENYHQRQEVDNELAKNIPEFAVRQFLLKNLARNEENRFYWRMNLPVIYENYRAINEGLPNNAQFDKPTLFIRGGRSAYIQDSDKDLIKKIFPFSQVITIANAGHWVHAEAPKEFFEVVNNFLKG